MALRAFVLSFLLFAMLGDSVNGVKVQFYGFFTGKLIFSNLHIINETSMQFFETFFPPNRSGL